MRNRNFYVKFTVEKEFRRVQGQTESSKNLADIKVRPNEQTRG